jgi:cytochrome c oxidase subunit 1
MYDERLGHTHFWMNFVGTNLAYLPMFLVGLLGMPRRVADYDPSFTTLNQLASIGGFLLGASVLPFLWNAIISWLRGPVADANPWRALTLEWQTSSPPPENNFERLPVVTHGPYDYGEAAPRSPEPVPSPAAGE